MAKREHFVDGSKFSTLSEAASEVTRALDLPVPWTGNLDTLDELLSRWPGGPGNVEVIVWRNSEASRRKLAYEETVRWYERHLPACDVSALTWFEERLAAAQERKGQTIFDWLVEIFRSHGNIHLRLE
jgi:hypothetical protein